MAPSYGTFGSKLKAKAKAYAGFDDETPSSVTIKDWFSEHKTAVRPTVSASVSSCLAHDHH
jgi:hypothetical protein